MSWNAYNDGPRPWDRLDNEGARAYAAFCIYRDLGPRRSISEAYRQYTNRHDMSKPNKFIQNWSQRFNWRIRAEAHDAHLERIRQSEIEETIRQAAQRHVKQCRNYGSLLNKFEQILLRKMEENPDLKGVTLSDLMSTAVRGAAILPKLQEAEMIALGKPTRVEVTGEGGGPLLVRHVPPVIIDESPSHESADELQ